MTHFAPYLQLLLPFQLNVPELPSKVHSYHLVGLASLAAADTLHLLALGVAVHSLFSLGTLSAASLQTLSHTEKPS